MLLTFHTQGGDFGLGLPLLALVHSSSAAPEKIGRPASETRKP